MKEMFFSFAVMCFLFPFLRIIFPASSAGNDFIKANWWILFVFTIIFLALSGIFSELEKMQDRGFEKTQDKLEDK